MPRPEEGLWDGHDPLGASWVQLGPLGGERSWLGKEGGRQFMARPSALGPHKL